MREGYDCGWLRSVRDENRLDYVSSSSQQGHCRSCESCGREMAIPVNVFATKPSLITPKRSDLFSFEVSVGKRQKIFCFQAHSVPSMKMALSPTFSLRLICNARIQG